MKLKYIFSALAVSALLFTSCEDEQTPNTANKGKEKPTVAVEVTDDSQVAFTLKFTPSSDVATYSYVVYTADSYDYKTIPSAYDLVTGSVAQTFQSGSFIKGDETDKDVEVKCVLKDYYQICTAAISKDGLLSVVDTMTVHIPGAHPDIDFVNAVYTVTPYTGEDLGDDAFNPEGAGCKPFDITLEEVEPGVFTASGTWFSLLDITFTASYNYSDNTLTIDGTYYGEEADGSAFGYIVANLGGGFFAALFGGGTSGSEPLVLQCEVVDKKAKVKGVKSGALEVDIYYNPGSGYSWQGVWGYFDEDSPIVFKEEYTGGEGDE